MADISVVQTALPRAELSEDCIRELYKNEFFSKN
jgi:hypothetical protein